MVNAGAAGLANETAVNSPQKRALGQFALLAAAVAVLFADAAASMASIWINSSAYHHGILVAPISFWLIVRSPEGLRTAPSADWLGARILAGACVLWLLSRASEISLIGHVALVVAFIGAVVAVYGRANASAWAFPLAFLFFMVPVGEEFIPLLQQWSSGAVTWMLKLSGVETLRDGFMLTTSAGRFEIARSCAGLRFILASAMISTLVAYLAFAGWRRRLCLIAAALAIALIANWLRAYFIILLATVTERRLGTGPEHVAIGWAFYVALIAFLVWHARRHADATPNVTIERVRTT